MENVEMAQDGLEHAHGHEVADPWTRRAAVMVAALAAIAVIVEMSANDAQTGYLAAHIEASDLWTQYQAKSVRHTVLAQTAEVLSSLPGDAAAPRIETAKQEAARMRSEPGKDGMEQLAARAHEAEQHREHELRQHEHLERGVRGLQIGIVLCSLFIVTRVRWLLAAGAGLGGVAAIYALLSLI